MSPKKKDKLKKVKKDSVKKNAKKVQTRSSGLEDRKKLKRSKVILKKKTSEKKKRKNYSPDQVQKAIQAANDGLSLRKAANAFGVPVATLCRMKRTPEKINSKVGPPTVLTPKEEEHIVQWVIERTEKGYPVTRNQLLDHVQLFMKDLEKNGRTNPFTHSRPGRHWFEGLKKRHPSLTVRRPPKTLIMTQTSFTEEDLRTWFANVSQHLKQKDLFNAKSLQVFNCSETCIQLCPKVGKTFDENESIANCSVNDASKMDCIRVLFMYNAEGDRVPPMVMFPSQDKLPKNVMKYVPEGWAICISEKKWMTGETFFEYITNIFYKWLVEKKVEFPVILYLDGSHVTIPLVSFCKEKQIELIVLHPNSTHIMQPLDIAFFHPFKDHWQKTVSKWKEENNVLRLKKEHCPAVINITLESFPDEKEVIKNGFKAAGLMPFNPHGIKYNVFHNSTQKMKLLEKENESIPSETFMENKDPLSSFTIENSFLKTFEKNMDSDLLEEFQKAKLSMEWYGDLQYKGLFDYWLRINQNNSVNEKVKPTIKSTLQNDEVPLIYEPVTNIDEVPLVHEPVTIIDEVPLVHEPVANTDEIPLIHEPVANTDEIQTPSAISTEHHQTIEIVMVQNVSEDLTWDGFNELITFNKCRQ